VCLGDVLAELLPELAKNVSRPAFAPVAATVSIPIYEGGYVHLGELRDLVNLLAAEPDEAVVEVETNVDAGNGYIDPGTISVVCQGRAA